MRLCREKFPAPAGIRIPHHPAYEFKPTRRTRCLDCLVRIIKLTRNQIRVLSFKCSTDNCNELIIIKHSETFFRLVLLRSLN